MADGTVSMADGLGLKALDSHELRRMHQLLDPHQNSQIQTLHLGNPSNPILFELDSPHMLTSNESNSRFNNGGTVPIPSSISTSIGSGAPSPNSSKIPNPSQEHQQQDTKEHLGVLSPKHNQSNSARKLHQDSEARMLEIVGHLEDELNNSEDPFVLDVVTAKLQDIQQAWRRAAKKEADQRAQVVHLHGNTYQFQRTTAEVRNSNPTPKIVLNPRGNPYVEGDPNLGYSLQDTKPRNAPPPHLISKHEAGSSSHEMGFEPQTQLKTNFHTKPPQTQQPFPKPNSGKNKLKPKNWASLLQSQSPSLDMKLEYFPDLQKGKEAIVEIDVELTDAGNWNRYLVGHFLDGNMAYPLLVSTARYQWKELFVAVKSDVSGFYLFEFKDEQSKLQVLEGGPYFFSQKYLVLRDWHRMMKPLKDQPTKIPAWVKFHDLPLELWNQECLSRVASTIGRPIHVDQATARSSKQPGLLHTKSTKARVCIEISADHELPDEVAVTVQGETVVVPIEYQVLPPMCSQCHIFGHATSKCSKQAVVPPSQLEWQVVKRGKQKAVEQSSLVKNVHPHQSPLPHVLSEASPLVQSKLGEHIEVTEDTDDSDVELLEVLESVVSSVVSNEAANKDSLVARSGTSTRSDDQQPVGDEKQGKPPDVKHAIPDVKLLLGGPKKASHNGRNRSQSKGSSHKKRK
ncbi:hypothetical protein RHGRI_038542 [Rhododendron griersonianum]|uniref:DUF4283 domain-containing protein n=1 Tax=Rhododendron griersonianum TaxID=479676 RepID=A0AAV6HN39_9ERIC|nr:hypothetical protein RHGRI_038542 [Rhododendron griersonianum]